MLNLRKCHVARSILGVVCHSAGLSRLALTSQYVGDVASWRWSIPVCWTECTDGVGPRREWRLQGNREWRGHSILVLSLRGFIQCELDQKSYVYRLVQ